MASLMMSALFLVTYPATRRVAVRAVRLLVWDVMGNASKILQTV